MQLKIAFFAILMGAFEIVRATDYCNKPCGTLKNIGCNNSGQFAANCASARMIPITQAFQNLIVNIHNTKRNFVAGGNTPMKPACRMATMQWGPELASLAALNVKQCQMKHDGCHNTDAFSYSGQNLAVINFSGTLNETQFLRKAINLWYNEISNTKMAYINSFPSGYSGPAIGHFTAMMVDRSYRVGCGMSTFKVAGQTNKSFLLACNYASTNMINHPIYRSCATAASGCTSGKNANYKNLCSVSEAYDVNNFT